MYFKFTTLRLPTMLGRRGWEYRSIANTLAILHTLAVFITFSFASVLLYKSLLNHLNQSNIKRIFEEVATVKAMLMTPNGLDLLDIEVKSQMYESESHKILIRVTDLNGQTINESAGMHDLLPMSVFSSSNVGPLYQKYWVPSGNLFLLTKSLLVENDFIGKRQIDIAMDISDDEALAKNFMNTLIIFSLFGLFFAVFSAFYIIRVGLKPLHEISERIQSITESNLDTRLDISLFPVEMQSLGSSFNIMFGRIDTAFKKLTQYSENLAHELRTPINNLTLEASVALSQLRTPEEYQKVISSSMEEYERLSLLTDRLLFLVRADNNQLKLDFKNIIAIDELENIAEFYSEELFDRGVTVTIKGRATVKADLVLFNRAVSNLFSNALKFTQRGGSITLAAYQVDNRSVEVSVKDNGSGIDPLVMPKIFDRYFWIESTRKKGPKGTGLGLDIVKTIMNLHAGSVSIQSELGKGTTVTLHFPVAV